MKKIQIQKNKLLFEDGKSIFLTKEMKQKFSFLQKEYLEEEEYETLLRYRMQLSAYSWLSKRDYGEKELELKLCRNFGNQKWVKELIGQLTQQGYLEDKQYLLHWISSKKYSRKKMQYLLLQKGFSQALIEEALDEAYGDPTEEIQRIWKKLGNREIEKKMMTLLRKGYHYSEIQKAISEKE